MSDEAKVKTFSMTLAGREIMFKHAGVGQVIMLRRLVLGRMKAVEDADEDSRVDGMADAISQTLDFIEALIVSEDDRAFVEEQMLLGKIDWQDLTKALSGGTGQDTTEDDQAPKPVKRASRKSPAKPAKTATPRGRAKR